MNSLHRQQSAKQLKFHLAKYREVTSHELQNNLDNFPIKQSNLLLMRCTLLLAICLNSYMLKLSFEIKFVNFECSTRASTGKDNEADHPACRR